MKLRKIMAGILAGVMAVSTMALAANAAIDRAKGSFPEWTFENKGYTDTANLRGKFTPYGDKNSTMKEGEVLTVDVQSAQLRSAGAAGSTETISARVWVDWQWTTITAQVTVETFTVGGAGKIGKASGAGDTVYDITKAGSGKEDLQADTRTFDVAMKVKAVAGFANIDNFNKIMATLNDDTDVFEGIEVNFNWFGEQSSAAIKETWTYGGTDYITNAEVSTLAGILNTASNAGTVASLPTAAADVTALAGLYGAQGAGAGYDAGGLSYTAAAGTGDTDNAASWGYASGTYTATGYTQNDGGGTAVTGTTATLLTLLQNAKTVDAAAVRAITTDGANLAALFGTTGTYTALGYTEPEEAGAEKETIEYNSLVLLNAGTKGSSNIYYDDGIDLTRAFTAADQKSIQQALLNGGNVELTANFGGMINAWDPWAFGTFYLIGRKRLSSDYVLIGQTTPRFEGNSVTITIPGSELVTDSLYWNVDLLIILPYVNYTSWGYEWLGGIDPWDEGMINVKSYTFKVVGGGAEDLGTAWKKGDVNGDGKITTKDALEILKYSVGKQSMITAGSKSFAAASITGSYPTTKDALEILKFVVGKESVIG